MTLRPVGPAGKGKVGELYVFGRLIENGAIPFVPLVDVWGGPGVHPYDWTTEVRRVWRDDSSWSRARSCSKALGE
jgi:hypothetical protein